MVILPYLTSGMLLTSKRSIMVACLSRTAIRRLRVSPRSPSVAASSYCFMSRAAVSSHCELTTMMSE